MKMTIAWHQECLNSKRDYLEIKENELARVRQRVDMIRGACATYERQIQLAISKGKDGFDEDKFGIKESL